MKETAQPILMVRRGDALLPLDDLAREQLRKLPGSKPLKVPKPRQARSIPQHRLYFALLHKIADNLDGDVSPEALHIWIKEELGITEAITMRNGTVRHVASSIAFDKMDQGEFQAFFDKVKDLVETRLFPRMGDAFEREARLMLAPPEAA